MLRRLFFAFPGGCPGVALLLLRAVFGMALLMEGRSYIGATNPAQPSWFTGLLTLAAGVMLLIGFLTPIVGALVAVCVAGVGLSVLPASTGNLFDSKTSLIFGLTILVTTIGLGPGAFSVDARLFGRREIIIPPRTPQSQDAMNSFD